MILHGTYLSDTHQFVCWGEAGEVTLAKKGRQAKIRIHPFAAPPAQLLAWLNTVAPHIQAPVPAEHTIWLPSANNLPHASPELLATGALEPSHNPEMALQAWKIVGLSLPVTDTVDLLLGLSGQAAGNIGSDLRFWRLALLQAMALVAGQQVIPALSQENSRLRAFWQPLPEQPEQPATLAKAMPPLCRALTDNPETAPKPRALLERFTEALVDGVIRQSVKSLSFGQATTPGGKWLAALTGENSILALKGAEADALFNEWRDWINKGEVAGNAAFRITFRLDAPDEEQPDWALTYLLQATDDPSLLVPAGQVWREIGETQTYLQQRFDHPQERLLAGLGFAARLFPPIERSLYTPAPERAVLDVPQAYAFLTQVAPLLQGSRFGVLLPRWWAGKTARLSAKVKLKSDKTTGKSFLSMDTLVNYEWQVMLGGEPITREEFERLAALKQPLVMVRGKWVTINPEQIALARKFFAQRQGQMPLEEAIRLGLDPESSPAQDGLNVEAVEASGWLESLLEHLRHPDKIEMLPPPADLRGQLRPYQLRGYSWLVFLQRFGLGACLADDMGLGKSIQAIALLLHQRASAQTHQPSLLVCPTSVVGNWQRELARFAPDLTVMTHQGLSRLSGEVFTAEAQRHNLVLTSYPLLPRDREILQTVAWATVILDEAQNIKNASTKQAQAARAIPADGRVTLTGTPVENRLSELWSLFNFLNPGYLGSEKAFREQYANPIERVNDPDAAQHLKHLTAPFILRRLKTDKTIIADLPEKLEMKVYCNLTTEQGTLYEAVVKDALKQVEEADATGHAMSRRGIVLAMLTKLKQICNHPAHFLKDGSELEGRSGKLARLAEMLEEVYATGDRALIFTQYAEMGDLLHGYLRDLFHEEPLWLYGGTPVRDRERMIARFQAPRGPSVFLLSLKAGGVGLNLTQANHVFHFDRWWNPAVENQATDRAFRIGQTRNVQVHKFISAGTLEEKIDEMIESKKALAESIIGSDESWLTELSTDALRDLVTLRREA